MKKADLYVRDAVAARARGEFGEAEACYRSALLAQPHLAVAIKGIADTRRQTTEEVIELARAALRKTSSLRELAMLYFAFGKCWDDLGECQRAWASWEVANSLERKQQPYSAAADRSIFEGLAQAFPEPLGPPAAAAGPIFIVGLPRSGSTLLERIVSAHPAVAPMGEQGALPDATTALAQWSDFEDRPAWEAIGSTALEQAYYARLRQVLCDKAWTRWTDKQLLNFNYVPLALKAFPGARILHISRHPLATALGIYRQRFQGTWHFAYSLEDIGAFMAGYAHLMHHWHRLAAGHILHVALDQLVGDTRFTVDRVLEFLELERHDACYQPEKNPAPIETMSSVQGRSPINARGLTNWRPYAHYLAGVREQLTREGIQVDSSTWSSSASSSPNSSASLSS